MLIKLRDIFYLKMIDINEKNHEWQIYLSYIKKLVFLPDFIFLELISVGAGIGNSVYTFCVSVYVAYAVCPKHGMICQLF